LIGLRCLFGDNPLKTIASNEFMSRSPNGMRCVCQAMGKTMSKKRRQGPSSKDDGEIRALIERWAKAVREENRTGIRADHDSEILMFDVPPPFLSRGLDAYMETWENFLSCSEKPVAFDLRDVKITAGKEVAFVTAIGRCAGVDPKGKREELEFRLTMCLRKIDGRWRIMHEHHSLPAE
jgi:uncharacterized protein (TIGR02246 family)